MKTKLFVSFVLLYSLISFNYVNAQWVQVNNGMDDRTVSSLAYSGNNIFAGTNNSHGVYLSTNNGASWTQTSLNNQWVFSLAVNGNFIFAGTLSSGVYISTNNGASWTQTSLDNHSVFSLAVNGNFIFAGTLSYGVYISTNNGTSWTQTSINNRNVRSLTVSGNNIFAGTDDSYGVYISTNNGTSWTQTSLNNQNVFSLVVNGNNVFAGTFHQPNPKGVYLSTNNGTNWTQTSLNNRNVTSLALNGNNVLGGTDEYGVYVSNNNGTTWTQRNEGLSFPWVTALCISNNYVFAGTFGSVFRRPLSELVGIQPVSGLIPKEYNLYQNYPNPFNPMTNVKFQMPNEAFVKLIVFDVLGREIATLVNEELKPGTYEVDWDGTNYSSGIYFYTLKSADFTETKKMILVK